jgi:hypothetical protein
MRFPTLFAPTNVMHAFSAVTLVFSPGTARRARAAAAFGQSI